MKIAVIDNYDSFTYNLVQLLRELSKTDIEVMRNDQINHQILSQCTHLVLSPGPATPNEAGELKNVIDSYVKNKKVLGVCLGHQALAEVFGGSISNLSNVYHGIPDEAIQTHPSGLFKGLPKQFTVGKYHSWVVDELPNQFMCTSKDSDGNIMSMEHKTLPIYGVQFHPESVLTPQGNIMIKNFLSHA